LLWPICRLWLARSRSFPFLPPGSVRWHHTAPLASILLLKTPHQLAPYCSPSAGTLLLLTGWHPTATHRLAPYCSPSLAGIPSARWLRSPFSPSDRLTFPWLRLSRGIALPPWVLSNALDRYNDLHDRASGYSGPTVRVFSPIGHHLRTPPGPRFGSSNRRFLLFWEACSNVLVFLPVRFILLFSYVSRGIVSEVPGGADFSYGLGVFDFSHEEVKRAVVCIYRFFSLHSWRCIRLFVPRNK